MTDFLMSFIMPSSLALILILLASILLLTQWRRFSTPLFIGAGLLLLVFSTGPVAGLLLSPLEYEYPLLNDPADYPEIKKIVVLTGYGANDRLMPLSSRLNSASNYRLLEAYNIYRRCSECEIIISGSETVTLIMKQQLLVMNVPKEHIITDKDAMHTYISAEHLGELTNNERFFLVTSAGHMRRALGLLKKQGMQPVPAPTDYQLPKDFMQTSWRPTSMHLHMSELAIHEYVGILWYRLRGKI